MVAHIFNCRTGARVHNQSIRHVRHFAPHKQLFNLRSQCHGEQNRFLTAGQNLRHVFSFQRKAGNFAVSDRQSAIDQSRLTALGHLFDAALYLLLQLQRPFLPAIAEIHQNFIVVYLCQSCFQSPFTSHFLPLYHAKRRPATNPKSNKKLLQLCSAAVLFCVLSMLFIQQTPHVLHALVHSAHIARAREQFFVQRPPDFAFLFIL